MTSPASGTDWKGILADLRAHLPARPGGGREVRGSLRWLEAEMRARGARGSSVRDIVYRDVGTPGDKAALRAILEDLAREVGRPLVPPPAPDPPADESELLGRAKRRAYRQFLAGVRAGRAPRLIVTGRAGAGKTILLDHLERALAGGEGRRVTRLNLRGEQGNGEGEWPLSPVRGTSFAAHAQAQADAARAVLPTAPGVLLARVTADLTFVGGPPRDAEGRPISSAAWAADHLLRRAPPGVAVLLALEDAGGVPADVAEVIALRPPTPTEARAYLMARLGVTRERADALVRETGRHQGRLALLAGTGGVTPGHLLADPDVRRLAAALAALGVGEAPDGALSSVLGLPVTELPVHARALLQKGEAGWTPLPALRAALTYVPAREVDAARRRLAGAPPGPDLAPFRLAALAELGEWADLAAHLATRPDDARHLPPLWPRVRAGATGETRETLARAVATHHAGRGEYDAPAARDALFTLLESPRPAVRGWARVKLAESSVDAGNFGAATAQLAQPYLAAVPTGSHDPWTAAAGADALLVEAALARWRGDLEAATRAATDPRTAHGGGRAHLWRGLIAKDAGAWGDALRHLHLVPETSPLLSARARYQEGDLRLRLGQPAAALEALTDAAARLEAAGGSPEERARVLSRAATTLRRLGRPAEGRAHLGAALSLLPEGRDDGVVRARLLSEGVPILLALGRPDEALADAARALSLLSRPGPRRAEAEYRTRRTRYRVALSYLTRGLGRPYLQPFTGPRRDHPDLAHARALLDAALARPPGPSDREQVLTFDLHLSRALADPDPRAALSHAEHALAMTDHPYAGAQARAAVAEARLRAGEPDAALAEINRAHALVRRVQVGLPGTHAPDPGLTAQLLALEARALIGDGAATLRWLRSALHDPALAPFRPGLWREAGRALEHGHPHPEAVVRALHPGREPGPLRVRDALALLEVGGEERDAR
ncbi:tetratricopeptide repeat protein [Deinococcus sp. YIM 134068]|uniref:tetratricopeptide repeat protein n=1 Tax=Deinococcus lichenicola TaxID=3118910 RepID=UPI002F95CC23